MEKTSLHYVKKSTFCTYFCPLQITKQKSAYAVHSTQHVITFVSKIELMLYDILLTKLPSVVAMAVFNTSIIDSILFLTLFTEGTRKYGTATGVVYTTGVVNKEQKSEGAVKVELLMSSSDAARKLPKTPRKTPLMYFTAVYNFYTY